MTSLDQQSSLKEEIKRADEGELIQPKPSITCLKENHYFTQITGTEVECRVCHIGYMISPGMEIKDGHIYVHGMLVI